MKRDPARLSIGGSSPELRALLRAARGDELEPESVERIRSGLSRAGVMSAVAGSAVPVGAAAGSTGALRNVLGSLSLKIIAGVMIGSAIGLVWFGIGSRHSSALKPSHALPDGPISSSTPSATEAVAAVPLTFGENPAKTDAGARGRPLGKAPAPITSNPKPGATPSQRTGPSPREGALLLEARKALDADPARALRLVRQHQAEFPTSQLEPERSQIALQAERRLR